MGLGIAESVGKGAGSGLIERLNDVVAGLGAEDARFLPASAQREDLIELQRAAERLNAGGEISYDHAAVIARSAVEVGTGIVRDAQQHLLPLAREVDPRRLEMATSRFKHCVDPDGSIS